MRIICKKCGGNKIKKNGKRQGNQRYFCNGCGFVWELGNIKKRKNIDSDKLFKNYVKDDLKYRQMGQSLNVSKRTIQRLFNGVQLKKIIVIQ